MAWWTRAVGQWAAAVGLGTTPATALERRLGSGARTLGPAAVGLGSAPASAMGWMDWWARGLGSTATVGLG